MITTVSADCLIYKFKYLNLTDCRTITGIGLHEVYNIEVRLLTFYGNRCRWGLTHRFRPPWWFSVEEKGTFLPSLNSSE